MDIEPDKLLGYVVAVLMRRNGYRVVCPGRLLTGRGTSHQIDAIGVGHRQLVEHAPSLTL